MTRGEKVTNYAGNVAHLIEYLLHAKYLYENGPEERYQDAVAELMLVMEKGHLESMYEVFKAISNLNLDGIKVKYDER